MLCLYFVEQSFLYNGDVDSDACMFDIMEALLLISHTNVASLTGFVVCSSFSSCFSC